MPGSPVMRKIWEKTYIIPIQMSSMSFRIRFVKSCWASCANRYITTTETISYENARQLDQTFSSVYPEAAGHWRPIWDPSEYPAD